MNTTRITRSVLALTTAFISASLFEPPIAAAGELTWTIKNRYRHGVQVVFFSQGRRIEWPAPGRAFGLADHATHTYRISCLAGETVCFGAWPPSDPRIYWGVGADQSHGCTDCCYVCGGETARQILE